MTKIRKPRSFLRVGAAVLLWLSTLSFPAPVEAANALVQSKLAEKTNGAPSASIAATFTTNVAAGNLIAVWIIWGDTGKTVSITDSLGNTYESAHSNAAVRFEGFYAKNITGGANTVTATFSASITAFHTLIVHEISGADTTAPLGQAASQTQINVSGVDSVSSTAVTTTTNGEYIFGATLRSDTLDGSFSAGTGYTGRETSSGGTFLVTRSEDQIQTSAGSIAATFTPSVAMEVATMIMTFKAASAATAARRRVIN